MPAASTTKRKLEYRLKNDPAPLDSDSDFNNGAELEPPKKKRRNTLSNKRTRHSKEARKSNVDDPGIEASDGNRDPLPSRRSSVPGTPHARPTQPQTSKRGVRNPFNPLYAMLGLTHDIFVSTFRNTSGDESDSVEEWTDPQNEGNQIPEFFPPVLPAPTINDSGSETDDQESIAKAPQPAGPVEDEETEDEDEAFVPPDALKKHGQKPDLIARSDQIATGYFRLKRLPSVEAAVSSSSPSIQSSTSHSVPASINKFLRDYQRDGVQFFYTRYCENRGGILGDDMGLGKTIQVIAFLAAIMHKENDLRDLDRRFNHVSRLQDEISDNRRLPPANSLWPTALIIVPVTVMGNWQRELDTWGYFEVGHYSGTKDNRENVLKDFKLGRLDIVLASFELVRDHIDEFDDQAWSCIFLDEAHKIKNVSASITKAFNCFHCQVRFGLTGTALQNDYKELWPLLSWSNPGRLGTANDWKFAITRPLTIGASQSASEAERKLAAVISRNLVDNLLPQFFLRRTKNLIKDQLPTKIDEVVFCPLTLLQIEVYQRFLDTDDVQLMIRKDEDCDCDSGKQRGKCCHLTNKEGARWTDLMLKYIDLFIKISNHLTLLYHSDGDSEDQRRRSQQQLKIAFPHNPDMQQPSGGMRPGLCGKWIVLEQLLDTWKKKRDEANKVLIFSKSVKLMGFLELELSKKFGRDKICYLDGSTKSAERMDIVDKFNNDPKVFVFLISTTAGGTGLNLTTANKVVIFDPNWNPAHDLQAMDRAYRYGQCRDVYVYRLLGAGSLEELIYARQIYKQQQMLTAYEGAAQTRYFKGVQGDKSRQGELFGLKNLFTLHPSAYTTKAHIERALVKELEWALVQGGKKEDDDSKKLGAFLIDDGSFGIIEAKPAKHEEEPDDVADILMATGVKYRHRNDHILKPTRVATQLAQADVKRKGKKRRRERVLPASGGAAWPPKRKKHANSMILPKAAMTSEEEQLEKRKKLLLKGGYIVDYAEDYHRFAVRFGQMSGPEQHQLFRELDNWESDDENNGGDEAGEEE